MYFVVQEKEMELESLREITRRDVEGINKKLQVNFECSQSVYFVVGFFFHTSLPEANNYCRIGNC